MSASLSFSFIRECFTPLVFTLRKILSEKGSSEILCLGFFAGSVVLFYERNVEKTPTLYSSLQLYLSFLGFRTQRLKRDPITDASLSVRLYHQPESHEP